MTALVGREVKRTFSAVRRYFAGLPGTETHEAGRQDFGYLYEVLGVFGARLAHGRKGEPKMLDVYAPTRGQRKTSSGVGAERRQKQSVAVKKLASGEVLALSKCENRSVIRVGRMGDGRGIQRGDLHSVAGDRLHIG